MASYKKFGACMCDDGQSKYFLILHWKVFLQKERERLLPKNFFLSFEKILQSKLSFLLKLLNFLEKLFAIFLWKFD